MVPVAAVKEEEKGDERQEEGEPGPPSLCWAWLGQAGRRGDREEERQRNGWSTHLSTTYNPLRLFPPARPLKNPFLRHSTRCPFLSLSERTNQTGESNTNTRGDERGYAEEVEEEEESVPVQMLSWRTLHLPSEWAGPATQSSPHGPGIYHYIPLYYTSS